MLGKGPAERDLPVGELGFGVGTTGGANAGRDARFGALLFNSTEVIVTRLDSGAERGFCDWSNAGGDATGAGLVDAGAGIKPGTGARVFSLVGDDFLAGVMGGTFAAKGGCDSADDGLFGDGAAGCASSDIASGEIYAGTGTESAAINVTGSVVTGAGVFVKGEIS